MADDNKPEKLNEEDLAGITGGITMDNGLKGAIKLDPGSRTTGRITLDNGLKGQITLDNGLKRGAALKDSPGDDT